MVTSEPLGPTQHGIAHHWYLPASSASPHRKLYIEKGVIHKFMWKLRFPFLFQENFFFLQACYLILQWKSLFLLNDCYGSECKLGAAEEGYQKVLFPFSHTTWAHASLNQSRLGWGAMANGHWVLAWESENSQEEDRDDGSVALQICSLLLNHRRVFKMPKTKGKRRNSG